MGEKKQRRVLVALGGNALESGKGAATAESQLATVQAAAVHIGALIAEGNQVIITHGNGPQVGRVLLQNEAGKEITPPQPLDVCGAMTQGAIGYHLQNGVAAELTRRGIPKTVVSLVTQVEVDPEDPAFGNPTKPIGPFYTQEEAASLGEKSGFIFKEDAGRGYRRVVPSPKPRRVVEAKAAQLLLDGGCVVIVAGGGGVPVVSQGGALVGVEAVIDKDLSATLLGDQLEVDDLFILTAVERVALNFGTPEEKLLSRLKSSEAATYAAEGHFAPGSMLPKMEAAIGFVKGKEGRRAIITSLEKSVEGFHERAGTVVVD